MTNESKAEMPEVYQDIFERWADVQREFEMTDPEPFRVLYARYSYEDYSGAADVFWQNSDGTFGYESGGHCSCWGLEGQWEPETYSADVVRGFCERGSGYGFFAQNKDWIMRVLDEGQGK